MKQMGTSRWTQENIKMDKYSHVLHFDENFSRQQQHEGGPQVAVSPWTCGEPQRSSGISISLSQECSSTYRNPSLTY